MLEYDRIDLSDLQLLIDVNKNILTIKNVICAVLFV